MMIFFFGHFDLSILQLRSWNCGSSNVCGLLSLKCIKARMVLLPGAQTQWSEMKWGFIKPECLHGGVLMSLVLWTCCGRFGLQDPRSDIKKPTNLESKSNQNHFSFTVEACQGILRIPAKLRTLSAKKKRSLGPVTQDYKKMAAVTTRPGSNPPSQNST